ncbi:H-type small acid-soluble spore protein [Thalassobacillus pellis]|uniref:H-type small acid-soluble spore protein n=1 Tax=Thalassobacillus pellis TaxID=748008 RepID=UPI001961BD33|nr:H-type small acid-soluble spore protein [Thalassobacillus pellis]MBM7551984.1 small acid-soluble spore protein H (minor) [Thalassobacillus pellis]
METHRAKEITDSPNMIPVTYNGTPVFIQHVDEKNETARIYPLDSPEEELEVAVRGLNEE